MSAESQGYQSERYSLIPRVLIFSEHADKLLLIKGSPQKKIWPNLYNGIGGHVERGENVLAAAKREFLEETGLKLINPHLSAIITIDTKLSPGIGLFVFKGDTQTGNLKPSSEGALEWVAIDKLHALPLVEDLKILLPKILNWRFSDPILFGQYHYDQRGHLTVNL